MLRDIQFPSTFEYRSGSEYEPLEFFFTSLLESKRLDLLLGYFSSSAIRVLSLGFANFIANDGIARIIINQYLSSKDKEVLQRGENSSENDFDFNIDNIQKIKNSLDDVGFHFYECLAWLITSKRLIIQAIKPRDGFGISHFKSGIFYDETDKIKFKGSCNFTYSGLIENLEELDVKPSWDFEENIFSEYEKYFEDIIQGKNDEIKSIDSNSIIEVIKSFGDKDLEELLEDEIKLLSLKRVDKKYRAINHIILKAENKIHKYQITPRFPYASGPREYQKEAHNNWVKNNNHGIFAMATGTGKTITSLNCLLEEYISSGRYHGLIVVPTITLVNQWEEEAKKFNFQSIIKVSSKHQWEKDLATTLSKAKRISKSFIVITTYASFIKDKFFKYLAEFPSDTLFITDEAHNVGSPSVLNRLASISFERRIGLSATPKRIYDPEGSAQMEAFFHDSEPYTYSFSMEKAINDGILCKYYYYPRLVQLTADELAEYVKISKQISKFYHPGNGDLEASDIVEKLLLKRKRIIHKAENKLNVTRSILEGRFKEHGNLKYTFIYVPEGQTMEITEEGEETQENIKLINQYTREIGRIDESIYVNQFISGMPDRDEVLDQFKKGNIQVIASMKCLDEGVDIPRAEYAIFCSSTGNPRQFIQRRGRILRQHEDKDIAFIYDLVVIPDLSFSERGTDIFAVERKLVEKELERVVYFASLSINPFDTEHAFQEVCDHYDLNIYTIHNNLKST